MKLEGKVAVVTAAGRGIGRAIALCLAREGADLAVNSYQEETTAAVEAEIKGMDRRALALPGDITRVEVVERVINSTVAAFGRIDIW